MSKHIRPAFLFQDSMVLQRDMPIQIWGWYSGSNPLILSLQGQSAEAEVSDRGFWKVQLPSMPAGGPYRLKISDSREQCIFEDIWIGDLWLMSGQSNMQLPMERVKYKYPEDYSQGKNELIRFFSVPERRTFEKPLEDFDQGQWSILTPDSLPAFSAVSYFFSQTLQKELNIPIGIINASIGGTPIQSWMSARALEDFPGDLQLARRFADTQYLEQTEQETQTEVDRWNRNLDAADQGLNQKPPWYGDTQAFNDAAELPMPGDWQSLNPDSTPGVFWLRKEIILTEKDLSSPARIWLGRIIESDQLWINGVEVGSTGYQYPPRIYDILPGVLKEGTNTLTLRVVDPRGDGCLVLDKPYYLSLGEKNLSLSGMWKVKRGCRTEPQKEALRTVTLPTGLYNGMIHPLAPLNFKGVVWYQGESNVEQCQNYEALLEHWLKDWQSLWNRPDLPVVIAQLPLYLEASPICQESQWAQMRDIQRRFAEQHHLGLAVSLDSGEWNDIHPLAKKEVGYRLAHGAMQLCYGSSSLPALPKLKSYKQEKGQLSLIFEPENTHLESKDGNPPGHLFGWNGEKWIPLKAESKDNRLVLNTYEQNIQNIRYGWADNPEGANLVYGKDLPLSPFEIKLSMLKLES